VPLTSVTEMRGDWEAVDEAAELLQEGSFQAAVEELLRVIRADQSENEYAHYLLGAAYFELEEWEPALKCYVRALEIAPEYIGALVGSGHALRQLSRFTQSIRMGRRALSLRSDDPDALFLLGVVYFQTGEEAAAKKHLQAYLDTNPEIEIRLEVQGMLQVLAGEMTES